MKRLIGLFLGLMSLSVFAQTPHYQRVGNYQEALDRGKMFATRSQYDSAISYYNAALAFEPDKKDEIDRMIRAAFEQIQRTVQQEQAQKTQLVSQQIDLQLKTKKAQEAEKTALENAGKAKKAQENAEASATITLATEKVMRLQRQNAVKTLYYFNALEFAKHTTVLSNKTLKKQMALTAYLLLNGADEVKKNNLPLEILKAMTEAQGGLEIENEGENTRIAWRNDSTFYFINHHNGSHLYRVDVRRKPQIEQKMWQDSAFLKTKLFENYIKKMLFEPKINYLVLENDDQEAYVWTGKKLEKQANFPTVLVDNQSFSTNAKGKILRGKTELSFFHNGFISQTAISAEYFASAGFDGKIILYRLQDNKGIVFYQNNNPIYDLAFSPNGKMLVFGDKEKVKILFLDIDLLKTELLKVGALSKTDWGKYKNGDDNVLIAPINFDTKTWKK